MVKPKQAAPSETVSIVLHSAALNEAGVRCDGGSTLIVGVEISASRALDLCLAGQISNTAAQEKSGFDLVAALQNLSGREPALMLADQDNVGPAPPHESDCLTGAGDMPAA